MATPPAKPGLELLIRRNTDGGADGPAFEVKVFESGDTFLRLRPQRREGLKVEENKLLEADGEVYIVRFNSGDTERYVRLSPREYFLFQHMDGVHSIMEIATAYVLRFGTLELQDVRTFLNRARRLEIVEFRDTGLLRSKDGDGTMGALRGWLDRLSFRMSKVDPAFTTANRWVGWLFSQWLVPLYLMVSGAGTALYLRDRFTTGLAEPRGLALWLAVVACWLPLAIVLHELAHGLACKRYGRKVKAVGFSFVEDFAPTFYVDVTDMLMSTRMGRIVVSLAGPLANLTVGGAAVLLATSLDPGPWTWPLQTLADVHLFLAAYTLWPFHLAREDGYVVLTDLLRVPALRGQAWARVLEGRRASSRTVRSMVALYLVGVALSVAAAGTVAALQVAWALG